MLQLIKGDLQYAAGIVDGEGCIYISKNYSKRDKLYMYPLNVKVGMTDKCIIEWFHENFGGDMRENWTGPKDRYVSWHWRAASKNAERFLEQILPYLKAKKEQAALGIEYRALFDSSNKSVSVWNKLMREIYYKRMRQLKYADKIKIGEMVA